MADALTHIYIDPSGGSDHEGTSFTDGVFTIANTGLSKTGAFANATGNDKFYLTWDFTTEVTPGMYTILSVTDDDNVVLTADIRSGSSDPTDVVLYQGSGTIDAPYATMQHALDNITQGTYGDQFNIKSDQSPGITTTTDDVLTGTLDLTTYGTPNVGTPVIIRGYSSIAGDGGIGGFDGDGSYCIILQESGSGVCLFDLHCHNSGANTIVALKDYSICCNIEVNNGSDNWGIVIGTYSSVLGCYIHNVKKGVYCSTSSSVRDCYVQIVSGATSSVYGLYICVYSSVLHNIIDITEADYSIGITAPPFGGVISYNSILSDNGQRYGCSSYSDNSRRLIYYNNLMEGFSAGLGRGINDYGREGRPIVYFNNAVYNTLVPYSVSDNVDLTMFGDKGDDNEEINIDIGSLFMKIGELSYENRRNYFYPRNIGNVRRGGCDIGWLTDKGNIQHGDVRRPNVGVFT